MATNHQQSGTELILRLAASQLDSLGTLRHYTELRLAHDGDWLWLRGLPSTSLPLAMQQLPAQARYRLDAEGLLFPLGQKTPTGRLPQLNWQPLPEALPVELPPSALPAEIRTHCPVRLQPTDTPHPGFALCCQLQHWKSFGETAAQARLEQLRFAVSENNQVLIIGQPLPPLPGKEYWRRGQLLLPAGFDLEWPIIAPLLHDDAQSYLLLDKAGNAQEVELDCFVAARRSAIRLSPVEA
ncbi:MAG: hypothetical protein AAGG75_00175 [Bacteroidota bacterium]